jgi:HSP20 family molecular chaperone IbpA
MTASEIAKSSEKSPNKRATPAVEAGAVPERRPRVDIYENVDELLLLADMPGAKADSVAIHLDGPELTVQAERPWGNGSLRYFRAFRVPDTIDPDGVSAELKQGVLHLHLKKLEAAKPRTIPVRAL